jgi:hypothetical protein
MATGKRVYYWITRGILNFTDREGGGRRLVNDVPLLTARLKQHPFVRDAGIVAFPDRRAGTGLYAFVEAQATDAALFEFFSDASPKAPEHMQIVEALPRDNSGQVRTDILQLVAMNQIDLIDSLIGSEAEKELVARIVSGRQNLRDRFAF